VTCLLGLDIGPPQCLSNDLELLLGTCHSLQESWKVDGVKHGSCHELVERFGRRRGNGHDMAIALGQRLGP
jgi:hypothetical protein